MDVGSPGFLTQILGWLSFGRVPALVLLVIFLTTFGLTGLFIQSTVHSTTGLYLPKFLAVAAAVCAAILTTRYGGIGLSKIIPKDESDSTSRKEFVGRVATIIRGEAKVGQPAEAKLSDVHGTTHYVLLEPDDEANTFRPGDEIIIIKIAGSKAIGIKNTNASMSLNN